MDPDLEPMVLYVVSLLNSALAVVEGSFQAARGGRKKESTR
jgi:hypothetical protein